MLKATVSGVFAKRSMSAGIFLEVRWETVENAESLHTPLSVINLINQ